MTPLIFGPHARRLFGLFHAPEGTRVRDFAVLLCAPMGHEALRSHRFYRLLALRLARQGIPVLRFDAHGTGDSPGDDETGDMIGWRGDVLQAHRELISRSGLAKVLWFGARIGATLAMQAAAGASPRVTKLVLWEPVLEGRPYLQGLREKHVAELEASHAIADPAWRRSLRDDPDAFTDEAFGFAISPLLRRQVDALAPEALSVTAGTEAVVIGQPGDAATQRWTAAQQAAGHSARWLALAHPLIWTSNPSPNNEMVPAEALQRLTAEIHA